VRWLGRLGLQTKVLILQVGIVLLVVGLISGTFVAILQGIMKRQYAERVMGVAQSVARMPTISQALSTADPPATIQPLVEGLRQSAGLAFIVVSNQDRIRYSHPNPELIGKAVDEDDSPARSGHAYTIMERGTLGASIRAKVPIVDDAGQVAGVVSAGILAEDMQSLMRTHWAQIAAVDALALLLGVAASFLLAGHVKRQIFGLEPAEIARLLEQREAMLHGIREGVIAVDRDGLITVVNDEARRLLGLPENVIGWPVSDVLTESRLPTVLQSGSSEPDQLTFSNGRTLVVSRMPVFIRGKLVGAIATLRDETEVRELARELTGAKSYLEALRAQSHEFANKLHTIAGLVELGWRDEALAFISRTTNHHQTLIEEVPRRIKDPALAALLVGKASIAFERGIDFGIAPDSSLEPMPELSDDLVTIVGNLVDNAFDALEGRSDAVVQLTIQANEKGIRIDVRDSGPGIPRGSLKQVFEEGFSTKDGDGRKRGVGLALVRRSVLRRGGEISVRNEGGAVFTVRLPVTAPPEPEAEALLPLAR